MAHTKFVHDLSGRPPLFNQLAARFVNMYSCMFRSTNVLLKYIAHRALIDRGCTLGRNINIICSYLRMYVTDTSMYEDLPAMHCALKQVNMSEIESSISSAIYELCNIADGLYMSILTCSEARELACYLSTH